VIKFLDLKD